MSKSSNKNSSHNDNEAGTKKSGAADQASAKVQDTTPQASSKWKEEDLERFRQLYGTDDPHFLNGILDQVYDMRLLYACRFFV